MKVIVWLIIAFMGLATFLTGIILFFQERVVPIIYGGYMVERPYWQIGYILITIGIILVVIALIGIIFIPIERKLREWAKKG